MSNEIDGRLLSLAISERLSGSDWASFSAADWEAIVRLAQAQGVAPLLYWRLSRSGRTGLLPEALHASLRAMYVSTRMKNEQIIKELEDLTALFARAGISVVTLKGACYVLTIYPDIVLRPMVDLDLLVPAAEHAEALRLVRTLGYRSALPEASPGLDALLNHASGLRKSGSPFTALELHATLVAEKSFTHSVPVDWFWSQTEPLKSMKDDARYARLFMLTPTAQLLYACAHAMLQHGGRNTSLRWLYDLDRLICVYADRMDWDLLLYQARVFEWGSAVSAALYRVVDYFDTPVPPNVLNELSRHTDRNTERVATLQDKPATHTLEEFQKLKSLDWYGRLRLILALLVPTPAYMRERYRLETDWGLPVWYLYRWWGIFRDGLSTMGLLFRNKPLMRSSEKPTIKL